MNTNFIQWEEIENVFRDLAAFTWGADYAHQITKLSNRVFFEKIKMHSLV